MDEMQLGYVFGTGVCQNRNVIRVISHFDELDNYGSNTSSLMMWNQKKKQWHHYNLGWRAIRMGCGKSEMFALGSGGEILRAGDSGVVEETVSMPGGEAAKELHDICLLGEHLYVVGSNGHVFRSKDQGVWTDFSQGQKDRSEISFNGISGLDESDIYAVGDKGIITRCIDGKWHEIDSGTDLNLHNVKVVAPATAYVTGKDGILIRIDGDSVKTVVSDESLKTLFGITYFNDKLYIATKKQILTLVGQSLKDVQVALGSSWTFGNLDACDGVMWSFGKNHLFWTEDGKKWQNGTPETTNFDPSGSNPIPGHSSSGCCTGSAIKCC